MHIIVKDPATGEILAILCIERTINSCQILHCDIDHILEIVGIAQGMKVNEIRLIAPLEIVAELEEMGWRQSSTATVMIKSNAK